jgi:hypothetical protein
MIVADARCIRRNPTILDIGCGEGLDGDIPLQRSVAAEAGRFIGIEPDPAIALGEYFTEIHRCRFEQAPIGARSIDLAYAVMVLEHISEPELFWNKLYEVLMEGGVFWALTIDARHIFARLSLWAERLRIKKYYLDLVLGVSAKSERYKNYPTYYLSNTPKRICQFTQRFRSSEFINFSRVGQVSPYLPMPLRRFADVLENRAIRMGRPGNLLATRVVK